MTFITRHHYLAAIFIVVLTMSGCSKQKLEKSVVESEFRHAWAAVHGENGDKGLWRRKLEDCKVVDVTPGDTANHATAIIIYTYRSWQSFGHSETKTGQFKYIKLGDSWQIEDRDGKEASSSTRWQITP